MPLKSLFEENKLIGKRGVYPLTAENLLRTGLALCTLLKIEKQREKPAMCISELNFLSMALSVGFMVGGGEVYAFEKEADVCVRYEKVGNIDVLVFSGLEPLDFKKLESILFSRYNMPRKEGEEIGNIWIGREKL
ncbi:conserved hypothetical protein [Hydrogenobacter thermophilus TK-6]|uniref:Uncharacterized protein n=1 Tax=Hydrogenobacter thermophilus (strain DSM 6534 / IAM 12695 / TK-6) TaxID=608538 RepID=D3DH92_HYDTT|nr:hypothetical protein [Hydrogenobacter thermophilus]ADO45132.1 conserved hypothetical protein [Hydrogenobacter thermophilus TK-6]BAI69194.1 hypothetical protein HTH_0734 [Hydrogenobacter thermophilus TK-6]